MIKIDYLKDEEINKYTRVFQKSSKLYGDIDGQFYKVIIDKKDKILQRRDDLFTLYNLLENGLVEIESFTIDENYQIKDVAFDNYNMTRIDGVNLFWNRENDLIERVDYSIRKNGEDIDGYNGFVYHVQYNQNTHSLLTTIYQQMINEDANPNIFIRSSQKPLQYILEWDEYQQNQELKFRKKASYIRKTFSIYDNNNLYKLALLKDFGIRIINYDNLCTDDKFDRYYRVLFKTKDSYGVTSFPFGKQYTFSDITRKFEKLGFKDNVDNLFIEVLNGKSSEINLYQEIIKELLNYEHSFTGDGNNISLKFNNGDHNGSNC